MGKTNVITQHFFIIFHFVLINICCFHYGISQPNIKQDPPVITGLNSPTQFVNAGDGSKRVFIIQQNGLIRVYDSTFVSLGNFLQVSEVATGGERGLLSIAFHPDYASNGFFYVFYTTNRSGQNGGLEIARYQVSVSNPNVANPSSKVIVLTIPHPLSNHNGGNLHFDDDGYLYLSTGDGGGGGDPDDNGQNENTLLGKLLRIEVNTNSTPPYYTIPADNPYGNENFAIGLRNPYRWSIDRGTGDFWIGDVGQNNWEEINHVKNGELIRKNFGWNCYEGDAVYDPSGCGTMDEYHFPVHDYTVSSGAQSVTGGVVYRGNQYPALQGWYFAADFYSGRVFKIRPSATGYEIYDEVISPNNIVNFGETEDGEVYYVSHGAGSVYQLKTDSTILSISDISLTATPSDGYVNLQWKLLYHRDILSFEIEKSDDGHRYYSIVKLMATDITNHVYTYQHYTTLQPKMYYRIKSIDKTGKIMYSSVVLVRSNHANQTSVSPNIIEDGSLHVMNNKNYKINQLDVMSMSGDRIIHKTFNGIFNTQKIDVSTLISGVYLVRISGDGWINNHKIIVK